MAATASPDGGLLDFLTLRELRDPAQAVQALYNMGLTKLSDLQNVDSEEDCKEIKDGLKEFGITLGDRIKINGMMKQKVAEEAVPQKVEAVPQKVEEVHQTVEAVPQKVEAVHQTVEAVHQTVEAIPEKVEAVPQKAEAVHQTVEAVHQTVEAVPEKDTSDTCCQDDVAPDLGEREVKSVKAEDLAKDLKLLEEALQRAEKAGVSEESLIEARNHMMKIQEEVAPVANLAPVADIQQIPVANLQEAPVATATTVEAPPCSREPEGCLDRALVAFVRAARPTWTKAQAVAVAEKLEQVGVSTMAEFESALADGENLNAMLRQKGLKAFTTDTLARFTSQIKEQHIQERWRLRRLLEGQRHGKPAAGVVAPDSDPHPTVAANSDSHDCSTGVDVETSDPPQTPADMVFDEVYQQYKYYDEFGNLSWVKEAHPSQEVEQEKVDTAGNVDVQTSETTEAEVNLEAHLNDTTHDCLHDRGIGADCTQEVAKAPPLRELLREVAPHWSEERLADAMWQLHDVGIADASELEEAIGEVEDDFQLEALLDPRMFGLGMLSALRAKIKNYSTNQIQSNFDQLPPSPPSPASAHPIAGVSVPDCPPPTRLTRFMMPPVAEDAVMPPIAEATSMPPVEEEPVMPTMEADFDDGSTIVADGFLASEPAQAEARDTLQNELAKLDMSIAAFVKAARPNWSLAHAKAARQKLELIGIRRMSELEAILADGGDEMNAKIREQGLKVFHADTLARFISCIKEQKIQQRWRERRLTETQKKDEPVCSENPATPPESIQMEVPSTSDFNSDCRADSHPSDSCTTPTAQRKITGPELRDLLRSAQPTWSEDRLDDAMHELANVGIVDTEGLENVLFDDDCQFELSLDPRMFGPSVLNRLRTELETLGPHQYQKHLSQSSMGTPTNFAAAANDPPDACRAPPSTPDVAIASTAPPSTPDVSADSKTTEAASASVPKRARRLTAPPSCAHPNSRASRDKHRRSKSHRHTMGHTVPPPCTEEDEEDRKIMIRKQFSLFTDTEELPTPPHSLSWDCPLSRSEKRARIRLINVVRLLSEQRELSTQLDLMYCTSQKGTINSFCM